MKASTSEKAQPSGRTLAQTRRSCADGDTRISPKFDGLSTDILESSRRARVKPKRS
jgi:hypothetical protein